MTVLPPCSKHFLPPSGKGLEDITCSIPSSWDDVIPDEVATKFNTHGVVLLKNFISTEEIAALRREMRDVLIPAWDPNDDPCGFTTDDDNRAQDQFLQKSIDTIKFFMEPSAMKADDLPKADRINKCGHGLHFLNDTYRAYCQSKKIANIVHRLGYRDPVIPQSMYIFKQKSPHNSSVAIHQDSSFLHTEPRRTCLGVWAPLDDCDEKNGCLWVRMGSHREPLRQRLMRNPDTMSEKKHILRNFIAEDGSLVDEGPTGNSWDGVNPTPEMIEAAGFRAAPMRAGDVILFDGNLDHMSQPTANDSQRERDTFQLHLVEGSRAGITWSKENWMQPVTPFPQFEHSPDMRQRYGQVLDIN